VAGLNSVAAGDGPAGTAAGSAQRMPAIMSALPSSGALASSFERSRGRVPAPHGGREPVSQFVGGGGVLPDDGPAYEQALDGFSEVQPRSAERVDPGMMPCAHSQNTIAGVLWPARLSKTNNARNGGTASGSVNRWVSPACHRVHAARVVRASTDTVLDGNAARISIRTIYGLAWC
jgi:hypothetical protein